MIEIVWVLILSVCTSSQCITQEVLQTPDHDQCISQKIIHEDLPQDGDWNSVKFECKLKNGVTT
tara:strand:+ start:351 stop:542 length:192 start_codon:yes stop_codon:yes gene_type:complete